ncbi:polysaccharide deacetylase family protein [Photobacterium salinisoli]|uniref:polysaccharide deacetylase family protein n=1 Tax=Photobacterium salinisoli TaxID=1616783 RepID=UPI001F08C49F|nr:polysaccharide deacetylase family protein [Photobacterium salinisoli]
MKKRTPAIAPLLIASSFAVADTSFYPAAQSSPLETSETPMFIALGFDDNVEADGLNWVSELLNHRSNPNGLDAFASTTLTASFFMHCQPARNQPEIINLWRKLNNDGHDIANHTETHPDDKVNYNPFELWMTPEQWQQEIALL